MDSDYRLLRFIEAQPYPVTWYTIRAMNIEPYATPVAALRALTEKGLLAVSEGDGYGITPEGRLFVEAQEMQLTTGG